MTGWRYAGNDLTIARQPAPTRSAGYRKRVFEPPGYDGISAVLDDGRMPARVSVTVHATTYTTYEILSALFESGLAGDLEIPRGTDAWVYVDAFVDGAVQWDKAGPDLWQARVEFVCPDPRPRWKSNGELVF